MRNLLLFLILAALVGVAYYLEEIKEVSESKNLKAKSRIFKEFNQLTGVRTKNYSLVKKETWWVDNMNYPGADKFILKFFTDLGQVKILTELPTTDDQDFFASGAVPFSLFTENEEKKYLLGDVSEITGHFYIKSLSSPEHIYLCADQSNFQGTYKSELDLKLKKYLRLKSILSGQQDLFINRSLFYHIPFDEIEQVYFKTRHETNFLIDLELNETKPGIVEKLKYKDIKKHIQMLFSAAVVKNLKKSKQMILSNPSASLSFYLKQGKSQIATLYKGLNGQYGNFVKLKDRQEVYEVDDSSAQIFDLYVDFFWIKKFHYEVDLKKLRKLSFKMGLDPQKMYSFEVTDLDKFTIISKSPEIKSINSNLMNFSFNLLLNLVHFSEAKRVEQVSAKEMSQNGDLYVELFDKNLVLTIKNGVVEVVDKQLALKYQYEFNTGHLGSDKLDKIFTVKEI